ncbi:MAG: cation transporter, partial [Proteobacteria bacterium]|nr:cation transporter [Pseudomonadota bacterium]
MNAKSRAMLTALGASTALTLAKIAVGLITMSMAVLASALDSLMDIISMTIGFAAVRTSDMPADDKHQFGHGKAEAIAGLVQATLIAVSATFLIWQSSHRIIDGYVLKDEELGLGMIVVALVASSLLARMLRRTGECTNSTALAASALNYGSDVWTNTGVLVALGLERWGHVKNADPIISILISLYIAASAIRIAKDSISPLMDRSLPREMLFEIEHCVRAHSPRVRGYHRLRTRMVGQEKHIEFHLEVDRTLSFEEAHLLTEQIIADIMHAIPDSHVMVHT